jgi:predicted transcriptional regulator
VFIFSSITEQPPHKEKENLGLLTITTATTYPSKLPATQPKINSTFFLLKKKPITRLTDAILPTFSFFSTNLLSALTNN